MTMAENTTTTESPLPTPAQPRDPETAPYWDAASAGRLVVPHCSPCGSAFWYPRGFCPRCGDSPIEWVASPGTGAVYSFTIVRRSSGAWADHAPYCLAQVTLDEGITVPANIVGVALPDITIGMRVRAIFQQRTSDDTPVLRFTAVRE